MAKILIVGHSDSDFQTIEKLLHAGGMEPALPSKREQMSPVEIDAALLKANPEMPGAKALLLGDKIANRQIAVNTVWQGLAMDLFLGNIDQPLWGWSDSQALPLLNYWSEMDDSIHFALVYDQPHSVLVHHQDALNSDTIEHKLQEWVAYNESLLHFYSRNQDCCLLVNSQQVKLARNSYVQQVCQHIEAPWQNWPEHQYPLETQTDINIATPAPNSAAPGSISTPTSSQNHLVYFLADFMIKAHPRVMQLYQELQAGANLPLHESAHLHADIQTATLAWQDMATQQQQLIKQASILQQQTGELTNAQQESEMLPQQLHLTQEELENIHFTHENTKASLDAALQEQNRQTLHNEQAKQQINTLTKEKQQLLNEHHQLVQHRQADQEAIQKLKADQATLENQKNHLEQIQAGTLKEKDEDNSLLLAQLHQVQEELERLFLENQRLSAHPVYYGAAERVRSQLDYRLGATMIQNSKNISGWLTMPFALLKERRKPITNETGLPALSEYQDAYEAEKMRKHLSYQLGQTLLKHSRNPLLWLTAPWALSKTVKEFRKQKQANQIK